FTITSLVNGTSYLVQVRAVNADGEGAWSDRVQATPKPVPGRPDAPSLTPGNGSLSVEWSAPGEGGSAITSYDVRHRGAGGQTWTEGDAATTGALPYTISSLVNGTSYEVQVRAVNADGDGPWSDSATATPRTVPAAPDALAAAPGDEQLEVSWSAPADGGSAITSYDVRYSGDSGMNWTEVDAATAGALSYTVSPLVNGTSYEVQVRAVNAAGDGAWSDSAPGVPGAPAKPAVPSLTPGDGSFAVAWTAGAAGSAITSYDVRYSGDSGMTWREVVAATAGALSYTVSSLVNGTSYLVAVRAVNAVGHGPWSESETGVPGLAIKPDAPVLAPGDARLSVSWSAPGDGGSAITSYDLQYSSDSGQTWTTVDPAWTQGALSYTISSLDNGMSYEVQVRAVNANGEGAWSDPSQATPSAEILVAPTAITLTVGDTLFPSNAASLIDGSGLSEPATIDNFGTITTSNGLDTQWLTQAGSASLTVNYFDDSNNPNPQFEVALGSERELRALVVWGANTDFGFGPPVYEGYEASEFTVEFSTDGGDTYTGGAETVRTDKLLRDASARLASARLDFSRSRRADHVRLTITDNAAGSGYGGTYIGPVGMSELRFVAKDAPPVVSSVTAPSGTYISGDTVEVAVQFSGPVQVSGVPVLALETGSVDRSATYASGSDTPVLVFEYTVQPGDESTDLDYISTNALSLPSGATIKSALGGRFDADLALPLPGSDRSLAGTSAVVVDHDAARTVSVSDAAADEGDAVTFTVSLSAVRVGQDVTLSYSTADGTATAGSDYTAAAAAALTIDAGQTSATLSVATTDDSQEELDETFTLTLSNPTGAALDTASATATGTIRNDDPLPAPQPPVLAPGSNQIQVSWTAPSAVTSITRYDVRHSGNGGATWTTVEAWTGGPALSHTIGSLVNGSPYLVAVRAANVAGPGRWSDPATATPKGVPAKPAPPSLTPGDGQLAVSWSAPADGGFAITRYDVRHSGDGGATWTTAEAWTSGALSYTVGSLVNGSSYLVAVRAANAAGVGLWSQPAQAMPRGVPAKPSALSAAPGDEQLTMAWDAPYDGGLAITSYGVRHSSDRGQTWTEVEPATTGALSYTVGSLVNGSSYLVAVRAVNAAGAGAWSEPVPGVPGVPAKADAPSVTPGDMQLAVSWSAPSVGGSAIASYDVRYSSDGGLAWTVVASAWTEGALSYTVGDLVNGTAYGVQVRAVNAAGAGAWSDSARSVPGVPAKADAPSVTPGDMQLAVSWSAP
ncbi:MAG: fibronectin type III domain-containing protein, partial [Acidimicrobiaceae bacterium]|nr:fibronectin type III domain-containing protein [Acidimicrobiaceae bacterium]